MSFEKFLYALGIRHIGLENAKLISKYCETKASSGSDLSVTCLEAFNANASSGAHIKNHESSIKTTVKSSSGGHIDTKN